MIKTFDSSEKLIIHNLAGVFAGCFFARTFQPDELLELPNLLRTYLLIAN